MSLTEFDIIDKVFNIEPGTGRHVICGIGDDAALVEVPPVHQLAISTDTLASGIHFFHDANPFDIGFKSLAVNLSDMAAMGAEPLWVTLSLTLPVNSTGWIRQFAAGFFQLAKQYDVSLIGGDLTHGPLSVTVQAMGIVPDNMALRRSTAKVGDAIYVTGNPGMAALALAILQGEHSGLTTIPDACLERLHRPQPRIQTGLALRGIASAAIDISDGLAADLGHILQMSTVGAEVELAKLPVSEHLKDLADDKKWQYSLFGGDDYELCFTVPARQRYAVEQLCQASECAITYIGMVTDGSDLKWLTADGKPVKLAGQGYRHF